MNMDISRVIGGMSDYRRRARYAVESYGRTSANRMVRHARQNRPWTDRTYHAKRGLSPVAEWSGAAKYKSGVKHTVYYGVYLEYVVFSRKGRLNILKPTLDKMAPEIFRGLSGLLTGN